MRKALVTLLSIAVAVLVPTILVVNGIRVLANDWYIHFEYGRPDFPPDAFGLTFEQRTELALTGLHSVLPQYADGLDLLRQARLPDGRTAFDVREVGHMHDVRELIGRVYPLHLIAVVAIIGLAVGLGRRGDMRSLVPVALRNGAVLTLLIAAGLIAYILINFNTFFTQFHLLFFEGTTWQFSLSDTLIRLYPLQLWSDASILIGSATVVQALAVLGGAVWWLHRAETRHKGSPAAAAASD